jgi:hypothetical protein
MLPDFVMAGGFSAPPQFRAHSEETLMTKSRYGLLAGIAGAAMAAALWWRGRTDWVARKMSSSSLSHE